MANRIRVCGWSLLPGAAGILSLALALGSLEARSAQPGYPASNPTAPHVTGIDWRTSPLDLSLRGLNGERFRFRCPPGRVAAGQVIGSGPYTDGSSICACAVHAGAIRPANGGEVTVEIVPGQSRYAGSLRHFVQSESYEAFWSGSFLVITDANAQAAGHARTS